MRGNNETPEFNQYGGFKYLNGQLYLATSVRIKDSPISNNQGLYYAAVGQRGVGPTWKNLSGQNINVPVVGMTQMNKLKIAEPLPSGHNGMTGSPAFTVTKNGALHFSALVNGEGTVHYYTTPGSTVLHKATGTPGISFAADDNRVYCVDQVTDKIRVRSTPEGQSNWRTDYVWNKNERFDIMSHEYHDGKIYIIAAEKIDSDRLPLHYIVLKLGGITPPTCSITPYVNKNNVGWSSISTVDVDFGDNVVFGPQSSTTQGIDTKNWSWKGPNNYSSNIREISLNNIQEMNVGTYTVSYTDPNGCKSSYDIEVITTEVCSLTTHVKINDGWRQTTNINVNVGDNVKFGPQSSITGADDVPGWSWKGPNNLTFDERSLELNNIQQSSTGTYTASFTTETGCTAKQNFSVSVLPITNAQNSLDETSLSIYPNPSSSGQFHLNQSYKWKVRSPQGIKVLQGESDLIEIKSKGLFFVEVEGEIFKVISQ